MTKQKEIDTKHTPGPWDGSGITGDGHILDNECHPIAIVTGWKSITPEEWRANLALMAAAPDLLAALEAIVSITDGSQPKDYPGALMVAKSAISKAKDQP